MPAPHHIDTHPVRLAIGIAIGALALIVGMILLVQFVLGAYASRALKDDPAMAPEAVAKRLAPVATLAIDPNAPAPAAASPTVAAVAIPPPTTKTAGAGASGKATYDAVCNVCHGAGVAGAPKFGDKAAWAARAKSGKDALHASALKGKGAMPPKGGNPALSEADVKAAVDYMLAAAK
jgi:cytochrome c5